MLKNYIESTYFAIFAEVVHNYGRSDMIKWKNAYFQYMQRGLMPNLIKKSEKVSTKQRLHKTWLDNRPNSSRIGCHVKFASYSFERNKAKY